MSISTKTFHDWVCRWYGQIFQEWVLRGGYCDRRSGLVHYPVLESYGDCSGGYFEKVMHLYPRLPIKYGGGYKGEVTIVTEVLGAGHEG